MKNLKLGQIIFVNLKNWNGFSKIRQSRCLLLYIRLCYRVSRNKKLCKISTTGFKQSPVVPKATDLPTVPQSLPFNNWNVFQKLIPSVRIKRKRRPGIIMPVRVLKDWTRPSDPCFRLIVVMVTFVGSVIWMCVWIYYGVVLSRLGIKFHEMAIVLFFVPIGANSLLLGNVKSFFFLLQSLPTLCKLYTKFTLSLTEPQVRRVQKQTHFLPCAVFVNKFF